MTVVVPTPRPASTVALLRPTAAGPEVLLTHRPATMAFGPGLHVFPGGAVDAADADPSLADRCAFDGPACAAAWAWDLEPGTAVAHAVAAIRELHEEAGVLLATHRDGRPVDPRDLARGAPFGALVTGLDLVLRTDLLVPLSRWVTPPGGSGRRYDTRFFVAALPDGAEVRHDPREVVSHDWLRPAAALAAAARGEILLWPPTSTTLRQLDGVGGIGDVVTRLAPRRPAPAPLTEVMGDALVRITAGAAGGIPGATVNTWLVGRKRVVVVDPGDPNEDAADAISRVVAARGGVIVAVVVTGAMPDLVGGAVGVAQGADVPLLGHPVAVALVGEPALPVGNAVDEGDVRLLVRPVPGAEGQGLIVLEAADLHAVLTGDLGSGDPLGPLQSSGSGADASNQALAFLADLPGRLLPAHD
ncbi:MAG: MBL fold metallo-hydrolase [Chloroflexota bacterium]